MRRLVPLLLLCAALTGCGHAAGPDATTAAATNWGEPSGSALPSAPASPADPAPSGSASTPAGASVPASPAPSTTAPQPTPTSASGLVQQLLAQVNQLRASNGLRAYTLSTGLIASAHRHNLVMSGGCGLSHQCAGEAGLGARISAQGVTWHSCGENIGESGPASRTDAAVLAAAKALTTAMYNEKAPNDGHRRSLLSTGFTRIGIDVVRDAKGTVWLTQDFAG